MMFTLLKFVFNLLLIVMIVPIVSKNLSVSDRSKKAQFVQRILNKHKYLDGRVRIIGPSKDEGNVYIYHAGQWGAVCDDLWDDVAATVVCRMFNMTTGKATHRSRYGKATEKFWIDDVVCQGPETTLTQCIFSRWGYTDCDATEVAGVICSDPLPNNNKKQKIVPKKNKRGFIYEVVDMNAKIRLVGGLDGTHGRVEVEHENRWGSLCHDGWTLYEAAVVCRHLGLGYASQAYQTNVFGASEILLTGVQCEGNETKLFMCRHKKIGSELCPRKNGHVAAVACTNILSDLELDTLVIEKTSHLQDVPMYQLKCAMEENCLSRTAYENQKINPDWQHDTRRLLRFTASSRNIGNGEFRPYLPKHLWQWHLCHMHYHSMEVFATFNVLNETGHRVAEGHKASFCLEDNTCDPGVEKKYSCKNYGDQGISVNCSDVYQYNIDCQWVDVTDVSTGNYTLKVSINPHARIAEQRYDNNAARCKLRLEDTYAHVFGCELERP